jgi:hypothetical protein
VTEGSVRTGNQFPARLRNIVLLFSKVYRADVFSSKTFTVKLWKVNIEI